MLLMALVQKRLNARKLMVVVYVLDSLLQKLAVHRVLYPSISMERFGGMKLVEKGAQAVGMAAVSKRIVTQSQFQEFQEFGRDLQRVATRWSQSFKRPPHTPFSGLTLLSEHVNDC
ncbi:hypothetical protein XENOCAPTIV_021208 [Xenoophorus captivus]|uniref:Uncharacterized protein n=1 Tax=Xenoophorus captivus TaxID=1517983 RepID=A0ABV0RUR8_9TELE